MCGRPFDGRVRSRTAGAVTFSLLGIVAEGTDNAVGLFRDAPRSRPGSRSRSPLMRRCLCAGGSRREQGAAITNVLFALEEGIVDGTRRSVLLQAHWSTSFRCGG